MHREDRAAKAGLRLVVSVVCGVTPPVEVFDLGTTGICVTKNRGRLRLVDLSRTPCGTSFGGVRLISEMARKNGRINRGVLWRFVINSARGRPAIVLPRHSSGLLRVSWLALMKSLGLTGRHGLQARLALASLASIVG